MKRINFNKVKWLFHHTVISCAAIFLFALTSCGGGGGGGDSEGCTVNTVVPDGLVAYYPFNNDYYDYSCNDYDGTGNGTAVPGFVTDRFGAAQKAVEFANASDNYVEVNHQSFIKAARAEVSVSFWINVKWPDTAEYDNYIILGNDFGVYYVYRFASPANHYLRFVITRAAGPSSNYAQADIATNTWVHIVGTYDSTNIKIYCNGALTSTTSWPGTISDKLCNLTIGKYPPYGTIDAQIDDFRIYDRVLSDAEILEIYNYHN
jgi:hypothetical protein